MTCSKCVRSAVVACLALVCLGAEGWPRDRAAARAAYREARQYHDEMLARPESERNLRRYTRAIFLYRRVIDHDPTYGACDDALFAVASLYEEMGKRFGRDGDRNQAIYYYRFVADEYPHTPHRRRALERARQLERGAIQRESQPPDIHVDESQMATVTEIWHRSNKGYARVGINLDQEVEVESEFLPDPDRLYFDLQNTKLSPDLPEFFEVNDALIHRIRVGQNRPGVVRIVLDFGKINQYHYFGLYDPFRLVVDAFGQRPSADAQVSASDSDRVPGQQQQANRADGPPPGTAAAPSEADVGLTRVLGLKVKRVALDPGHGGEDTGTIGPSGLLEKDLVLDVSRRLKELLETRLGTEVILTRSRDEFIPLEERTAIANQQQADLFISIHANSARNREASGVETFILDFASEDEALEVATRENASSQRSVRELEKLLTQIAYREYNHESQELAQVVQQNLFTGLRSHRPSHQDRGVKRAPFIVLIGSRMPSILTEIGFLSNPSDENYLRREEAREHVAEALYGGIEKYFRELGTLATQNRTVSSGGP